MGFWINAPFQQCFYLIDVTGSGDYQLYFANMPGSYTVPAGDEGGALTNGGVHAGTIDLGDLDLWTFQANAKDTLRGQIGEVGSTSFDPPLYVKSAKTL